MNSTKTYIKLGAVALVVLMVVQLFQQGLKLSVIISAVSPLITGLVIAYLINIVLRMYEKIYFPKAKAKFLIKSRRPVCLILALVSVFAIITLIIALIIPELGKAVQLIIAKVPAAIETVLSNEKLMSLIPENFVQTLQDINWSETIVKMLDVLKEGGSKIASTVTDAISSVVSVITTFVIGLIFAIYILAGKEKLRSHSLELMEHYLSPKWNSRLLHFFTVSNRCFNSYIVGQMTDACLLGVLCTLGMLIMRLPYAATIGVLVGFTALIPVVGAYIGAGVGAFLVLTESPIKALIFLIFILILQQLEGNLIYPKIVGDKVGLPAIWVLAAVTVGGGLGGIVGMLVGVPIAATIYSLVRENIYKKREEKALLEGAVPAAAGQNAPAVQTEKITPPQPEVKSAPSATSRKTSAKNTRKKSGRRK